jgi:hypothetical protein
MKSVLQRDAGNPRRILDNLLEKAKVAYMKIRETLIDFDYVNCFFTQGGLTSPQLCNLLNLFFRRGLYFDPPFPPLLGMIWEEETPATTVGNYLKDANDSASTTESAMTQNVPGTGLCEVTSKQESDDKIAALV